MKWLTTETFKVKLLVPSGLTVAGLIGGVVGYVVASKTLEKKFREIADNEIQEAKVFYQDMYSRPVMVAEDREEAPKDRIDPVDLFEDLPDEVQHRLVSEAHAALRTYNPAEEEAIQATKSVPSPTIVNVFANATPPGEAVMAALLADRDPSKPYIITKEEYFQNDPDHEQKQFTFYAGDGILVDDQEEYDPIPNNEPIVGEDNLLRFGYGSGDEHTLYIRNETLDPPIDLYVTRSVGSYMHEVLGGDHDESEPHLKHSVPRRFRNSDE